MWTALFVSCTPSGSAALCVSCGQHCLYTVRHQAVRFCVCHVDSTVCTPYAIRQWGSVCVMWTALFVHRMPSGSAVVCVSWGQHCLQAVRHQAVWFSVCHVDSTVCTPYAIRQCGSVSHVDSTVSTPYAIR